jgi:hypothetical protein
MGEIHGMDNMDCMDDMDKGRPKAAGEHERGNGPWTAMDQELPEGDRETGRPINLKRLFTE